MEEIDIGYLKSTSDAFIFLALVKTKRVSFEIGAKGNFERREDNIFYDIKILRIADFLEKIKFRLKVRNLEIYSDGKLMYQYDKTEGISSVSFSNPVPLCTSLNIKYALHADQFYRKQVPNAEIANLGFPVFEMKICHPEQREFSNELVYNQLDATVN